MDHNNLPYQVVRSKRRKTAQIRIKAEKIEIRIPAWVSDQWVEKWVSERGDWIRKKWTETSRSAQTFCLKLEQGSHLPLLGEHYQLHWKLANKTEVTFHEGMIQVNITSRSKKTEHERVKQALTDWYKIRARDVFTERLNYWQSEMGLYANLLKIKGYRRRWGSCTSTGEISLNWKLVFAYQELIDYVVIHEIAHLQYLDHGKKFWHLVEQHCPEWKQQRNKLNQRASWLEW
ncbi:MAG: M48 family metallopeptidase [Neptuniibacter sp.]